MKKTLTVFLAIHAFLFSASIFQSCCRQEYRIHEEGGYLRAMYYYDDEMSAPVEVEVIQAPFKLIAEFGTEVVQVPSVQWLSSAYALKCDYPIVNLIEEESIVLTLSESFVWNGDTLAANTDLLQLEDAGIELPAAYPGTVEFDFTKQFFDQVTWISEAYTFQFSALTNDGVQLDASLTLPVE